MWISHTLGDVTMQQVSVSLVETKRGWAEGAIGREHKQKGDGILISFYTGCCGLSGRRERGPRLRRLPEKSHLCLMLFWLL